MFAYPYDMTGHEIALKRKRLGLTQAKLGEKLGHHQTTIAKWEKGAAEAPLHISAYLDAEIGRLDALAVNPQPQRKDPHGTTEP